ncbi:hypothetical protein [Reichenbachiella sp. MSK19-1]|uniref:hypothetical protein n=1 Tax=Reichenbachiella sp. MSK19-1 TaxID=1897631 RepID=UPI000E6B81B1|nr:hypothetical protein [Reichenbachiella sp. MSK19-1]RJE72031.1 hypothetical protein BGP76_08100 [Reichenbachiella sp. MSK19-1]
MGTSSKNIFIQVDTNSVLLGSPSLQSPSSSLNALALQHTMIFSPGSMSLGNSVTNFTIGNNQEVKAGSIIYFTILPLQLYSTHSLYFASSNPISAPQNAAHPILPTYFKIVDNNPLSLGMEITNEFPLKENVEFCLNIILDYHKLNGDPASLEICIDPKLKVGQGD